MTEAEWLAGADPLLVLEAVRGAASARKLRLFQVACVRWVWRFVTDPGSRAVVVVVERLADGPVDEREMRAMLYDWLTDDCGGPGAAERQAFMVAGPVGYSSLGPVHGAGFLSDDWRDVASAAKGGPDGCPGRPSGNRFYSPGVAHTLE